VVLRKVLTVGSLFAGIGGFDLGLERTGGFKTKWQVEIDSHCQRVLAKHWPDVQRYGDIRTVTGVERVDVLCGGFPCQDISNAGKCAGIDGERSGLWSEYVRLIRELRPRYVLVENVAALLGRGMGRVLGDLSESGYDAEWDCIPGFAVGSPQIRDRVFIVAYPQRSRLQGRIFKPINQSAEGRRWAEQLERLHGEERRMAVPAGKAGGITDGVPNRAQRLRACGNAIVPQIAEWIGYQILKHEEATA
jgi:DNA (cytosine-5)-methyltransferase 1